MTAAINITTLKDNHRLFLERYADTGNHAQACREAGFSRANGYKVMNKHGHLLEQMVQERIAEAGLGGLALLRDLVANTKNDMVKFNAIKYLMNLAGYVPTEKKELSISGLSDEQVEAELKKMLNWQELEEDKRAHG